MVVCCGLFVGGYVVDGPISCLVLINLHVTCIVVVC